MLIELHTVLALFLVAIAVIAVPGPSVLFIVSRGVSLGRRAALTTVLGNEAGLVIQVAAVSFGLGVLVETSVVAYTIIKIIGAAYLIYLGIQAIRHRRRLYGSLAAEGTERSAWRTFLEGLVVGATNPKGLLMFAAILPQFVNREAGNVTAQMLLLGAICVFIALVSDSVWALAAGVARSWLVKSARRMEGIGAMAGLTMIGLGVRLAFTGPNS